MRPKLQETNGHENNFRPVPLTGVIYVMTEARKSGYFDNPSEWVNFGQGQPEVGPLEYGPQRVTSIDVDEVTTEYAPVGGVWELRQAVADYYNRMYRKGMRSQYSAENVAISPGGRSGLTRIIAALGQLNLGHFLPDYTAYEEILGAFRSFNPIPILLEPERNYEFSLKELRKEISGRGLGALLLSNPCNPTGKLICGEELEGWVNVADNLDCALILDEFYSRYIWDSSLAHKQNPNVSAAEFVDDVNKSQVIIIDGLTKNWRYPGWRISWTVGPRKIIESVASAGSFLDGGASHPMQQAAIPLLEQKHCEQETLAIQTAFRKKRQLLLQGIQELGIEVEIEPGGTFYVWGNLSKLPEPMNTGKDFFEHGLKNKLITVPGEFFDVNPGRRRYGRPSRFRNHTRLSFGPSWEQVSLGLERIKSMISNY